MILDSRIKEGKRPLTCFDTEEASKFVDEKGYFSDCLYNFQNLDNCSKSILHCIDDKREDSNDYIFNDGKYYCRFFLPEEWIKEPKTPEFEPYTLDTWGQDFKPGDVVFFRGKKGAYNEDTYYKCMYLGHVEEQDGHIFVMLGIWSFSFVELFNSHEIYRNGTWEPFGRKTSEG